MSDVADKQNALRSRFVGYLSEDKRLEAFVASIYEKAIDGQPGPVKTLMEVIWELGNESAPAQAQAQADATPFQFNLNAVQPKAKPG
jgi:hypothetical protein